MPTSPAPREGVWKITKIGNVCVSRAQAPNRANTRAAHTGEQRESLSPEESNVGVNAINKCVPTRRLSGVVSTMVHVRRIRAGKARVFHKIQKHQQKLADDAILADAQGAQTEVQPRERELHTVYVALTSAYCTRWSTVNEHTCTRTYLELPCSKVLQLQLQLLEVKPPR